ncbi:MAG: nucleotidyltransferase domain-containing protein [Deltaproteobacteria bacterium]|nr:nucleotidyltransferase domain-containing protein [Deltaproteobacteria bacterium]
MTMIIQGKNRTAPPQMLPEEMAAVKNYFTERNDVAFAYLFGSKARGTGGPLSDIDIAIYLTEGPFSEKRIEILGDLIDILRTDNIDLILLNTASESLRARVIRNRLILADNLPFTRHRFESQTMRAYMDFSKMEHRILERRYLHG